MSPTLKPQHPTIIAHRGASGAAPENTLASFRAALETGATALELDVHRTADGEIVVIHDATVDRTTDGAGRVSEMTLDAIRRLDAGSWRGPEFAGERVPTLAEVCRLARGRAFLFVELKADGIADDVLDRLTAEGMDGQSILISFSAGNLRRAKELRSDVATGLLTTEGSDARRLAELDADALCLHYRAATEDLARSLHADDRLLMVWTVNEPDEIRRMAALGADFIATDYPDRGLRALSNPGG